MAVTSAEEFFAVLEKSQLLIPAQLAQAQAAAGPGDDPKTIAKRLARQDLITRWQAGQLLAGRSAFYLGKYRLIELLGRGGMGSVFLGEHVTMNRRVALMVISREVSKDPAALQRFLADARAIAALDHPNIVQAYSVDNEGDRYYLVTEFVEGVDLQRLVDEDGPLDCDRAVDYVRQAADGLDYAHQHNMIHYGIRPSKLLVNLQGVLKIIDLGLAWLSEGQWLAPVVRDQQELDAVDYLAPEQTLKDGKPDARADIYSLGCVLHFALIGHPSFRQGTPSQRVLAHQTRDLPDLHVEQPKVPEDLAAICKRMTARNPADRYQTVAEVSRALAERQTSAPPVERAARAPKAKPVPKSDSSESFGIDFEEAYRQRKGKKESAAPATKPGSTKPSAAAADAAKSEPTTRRVSRQRMLAIVLAVLLVLLGLVLGLAVIWSQVSKPAPKAPTVSMTKPPPLHVAEPEPPKPQPPKSQPAKTEPPKPELPKSESKPVPPKSEPPKPEPKSEPKPEPPKVEPPKSEPPKSEPAKKVDPLAELADAVDLPPLPEKGQPPPADATVSLGKIPSQQAAELAITLVGGMEVLRGGRGFVLEREGDGPAWLVHWQPGTKGSASAASRDLAKISLDQDMLQFRWLEGAAGVAAGYLSNCGLLVTVGESSRPLPLCRPKSVEAIVLDWDRRTMRANQPRANLAEAGSLRLQVTGFSGPFPNGYVMTPAEPVGPKGKIDVAFNDAKLVHVVLRIAFDPKAQGVQIEIALLCQLPGQAKPIPLSAKEAERMASQMFVTRNQVQSAVEKLDAKDPKRKVLQQVLDRGGPIVDQMTALGELYKKVNKAARMHFRVFNQFDDRQIDLLTTPPPTAKAEGQSSPAAPSGRGKKPVKKQNRPAG